MKLLEYQAKDVFRKFGIPTPRSAPAGSPEEAEEAAEALGGPVAVKAQLPVGGRGKAGGILFAETPEEAAEAAGRLLGSRLKDFEIRRVLVEEKLSILDELYIGVAVDRRNRAYVVLASSEGGVDIEEVASKTPEKIVRHVVDPLQRLRLYQARSVARQLGYSGREMTDLADVILKLYEVAFEMDAELTEINPLAVTESGFVAADARLNIDRNALFRHPELSEMARESEASELSARELEAREEGLTYVELDGEIGIIGNGAGLTMATIDTVTLRGGRPANFLDLGGGASPESIEEGVSFVLSDPRVRAVFVNILGGITRCDDAARGIIDARRRTGSEKPIAVRMTGTNEEEGVRLLSEAGIDNLRTMEEAAERVVALAGGG
ncbi:MAG: ADP-forming succinate--CoA ligase subunit beta [Candidatus Bathyarchaeota archaeon]|nr:ADP-forming succinate--CoA ligase subunit beta [Candidatus Bathyarchaeota archaeon]